MKTKLLLNLVLLCVAAALIVVAVFEPGKEKPQSHPLTSIDESAIQSVTLKSEETIVFERRDGHWWLKSPLVAPANEIRIRQLVDIARSDSEAQYPLKPEERAKFELDKPRASLTLGETTLYFGGADPIDMRRYVEIAETLHLVRDDFFHHLTAKATDYVDKKLLPDDAKVTSIAVPGIKATLSEDGKWTVEPPPATADSQAVATALLNAWQSARAIDVKRWEKPNSGEMARIGLSDGKAIDFAIIQREPELLLGRSDFGLQYEIVSDAAKQLLNQKLPEDSVNKGDEDKGEDEPPTTDESREGGHEHDDDDMDEGVPVEEGNDEGADLGEGEEPGEAME